MADVQPREPTSDRGNSAGWFAVDPTTGAPVRVLPSEMVEKARSKAFEADSKVAVLCEAAARLRVIARRAVTEGGTAGDDARRELREGLDWIARGGVEPR